MSPLDQCALSVRATEHVNRARVLCGLAAGRRASERTCSAEQDRVAAASEKIPAAAAAMKEAQICWWALARSESRIAYFEAKRMASHLAVDLEQEAFLGLFDAARRFDPSRGVRFKVQASWWARARVHRAFQRQHRVVHIGEHATYGLWLARRHEQKAEARGKTVSVRELADVAGVGVEQFKRMVYATAEPAQVDDLIGEDTTDESIDALSAHEKVLAAIATLPERHAAVLHGRLAGRRMTDIGVSLGCSRERVRQLSDEAIEKLRKKLGIDLRRAA